MRFVWRLMALAIPTILLAGCSVTRIADSVSGSAPIVASNALSGRVHGGPPQAPISGAHVYMYAIYTGTGAYTQASTPMLSNTGQTGPYVVTGPDGSFKITKSMYTCVSGTLTYLYSTGGNPGMTAGTNNTGAGLMAVLGDCANFPNLPPKGVQMNEVTTVAAAYALGGYATSPTQIDGNQSGTIQAKTGLANAVAMAGVLASLTTGKALAPGINGTAVQQEINSLANSLAACVNTTSNTSGNCNQLLPFAGNAADTAAAAINIAHTGGGTSANIAKIYSASTAYLQFTPTLGAAPNDWTLAITYSGNLDGGTDVAIDSLGNAYVTETDADQVDKFTPIGAVAAGSPFIGNGMSSPGGIAIDGSDNAWVANYACTQIDPTHCINYLSAFTSAGAVFGSSPFTDTDLTSSFYLAIDGSGNVWVTNSSGNTISEFYPTGAHEFDTPQGSGGLNGPDGIAIDGASGNVWVSNPDGIGGTTISKFNSVGAPFVPGTGGGLDGPIRIAIDHSGNAWTANYGGSGTSVSGGSVSEFSPSNGTPPNIHSPYTGGGVNGTYGGPYSIAIDGENNVWVSNYGVDSGDSSPGGSISEFDNSGNPLSPANGFQPGVRQADSIAIDGSGNVWVVGNKDGIIVELVGAAFPVVTPLATAVKTNTLGTRP